MEKKQSKKVRRLVYRRVRTGCLTCKIRKVKCDETRPCCTRCESTGRKCDGYSSTQHNGLSQLQLSLFPGTDSNCRRSLDRFYYSLESSFALPLNYIFWSRIVARLIVEEPAARHATISLMSLYERTNQDPAFVQLPYDNGFSIRHYNRAMKEIRSIESVQPDQLDTILIVCVLFASIEFTRKDMNAAMTHIKHGIELINASKHVSRVAAVFRYMSLTPVFVIQSIWTLPLLTHSPSYRMPERFGSFTEVQGSINSIQYDAVKLARMKGEYRAQLHPLDLFTEDMPQIIVQEQQRLKKQVDSLQRRFASFRDRLDVDSKFENISCILQLRWTMLKIWVICLGEKNTVYDSCLEDFAKIINYARKSQLLSTAPGFMLEVGLLPYLFFVVAKCRNLQLRLRALSLIQKECYNDHDIFWDPSIIYGMSKRILRAEHGLKINDTHATVLEALRDSPFFAEDTRLCHEFEAWETDTRIDLPEVSGLRHGTVTGSIPIAEALGVSNWKRDQPCVVV